MASQPSQSIDTASLASAAADTYSQAANQVSASKSLSTQMQAQSHPQPSEDYYPHQVHGLGGPAATAPFLQDFSLVAEAAKRAEMSVMMRDLEGISL